MWKKSAKAQLDERDAICPSFWSKHERLRPFMLEAPRPSKSMPAPYALCFSLSTASCCIYVYTNNLETEGLASHRWACLRQIYIGRRRKRTLIPCCPKHLNLDMLATEGNIMMLPPVSATASHSRFLPPVYSQMTAA